MTDFTPVVYETRTQAKGWFLTYPRCPLAKEDVLNLLNQTGVIKEYVVCEELHKDGAPHLHAFIKYNKKTDWKKDKWDLPGYHGSYEVAKSWIKCEKYCKKDGNYISNIDVQSAKAKKGKSNKELLNMDPVEAVEQEYCTVYQFKSLVQNQALYHSLKQNPLPRCTGTIPNHWGMELPVYPRKHKRKHYWFWSPRANQYKTTFLDKIFETYKSGRYNFDDGGYQSFKSDAQFLLFEEFSVARLPAFKLNQMCDGSYQYPIKGVAVPISLKDPILLCCGNAHPETVYPQAWHLIYERFNVIELTGYYLEPTDDGDKFVYHPNFDLLNYF